MNTHELADQLEACARLLRALPDMELRTALNTLTGIAASTKGDVTKASRPTPQLPQGIEKRLAKMTPREIEEYLGSESEEAFTATQLMELADRLGIGSSRRQSRSALINLIARHFEAGQLDSMIRGSRKDE